MKHIKKFVPVLLSVILLAAMFVVPVAAQEVPPFGEVGTSEPVEPPVFDWEKISDALEDLLTAFLIPAIGFAARWMYAKGNFEYSKLTEAQKDNFRLFLRTAVYAAEQMNLKGRVDDKLDYVVNLAEAWLAQNRLNIDLDEIRLEVEAIVAREFNMGKFVASSR